MTDNAINAHRQPVLAANWKMNHPPGAASAFLDAFLPRYAPRDDRTVILFPPALSFAAVRIGTQARPDIRLGVQNVHGDAKGAFTGENSAAMAGDAGATYVLVGHSERRHVFHETDAESTRKCARVAECGLVPVLCVGETIEQRERGDTEHVVLHQLRSGLSALSDQAACGSIIAYEPVWAIGTGRTATPDDAAAIHRVIRQALVELLSQGGASIPILYGGSVTPANAATLLSADQVGGLLVGGASLDPEGWASICAAGP